MESASAELANLASCAHNIGKLRNCCSRRGIAHPSLTSQRRKLEEHILSIFKPALEQNKLYSWVELIESLPDKALELFKDRSLLTTFLNSMRAIESGYVDLSNTQTKSDPNLIGLIYAQHPEGIYNDPSDLDGVVVYNQSNPLVSRLRNMYETRGGAVPAPLSKKMGLQGSARYVGFYH